jgi:hypothetical protein
MALLPPVHRSSSSDANITGQMEPALSIVTNVDALGRCSEDHSPLRIPPADRPKARKAYVIYFLEFCAILWAMTPVNMYGTSVVLYKIGNRIYAAADSKLTRGGDGLPVGYDCKIVQLDRNTFFAHARLISIPSINLRIADLAKRAFTGAGGLADKMRAFEGLAYQPVADAIAQIQRGDPVGFESELNNKTVTEALFFGIDPQTHLTFVSFRYTIARREGERIDLSAHQEDCPGTGCPDGRYFRPLGEYDCINLFLQFNPGYFASGSPNLSKAVLDLVRMEIKEKPADTGGQISTVLVTGRNARYIAHGVCPVFEVGPAEPSDTKKKQ